MSLIITKVVARDTRFPLGPGAGSDAVHLDAVYSYAVCELYTENQQKGSGLAFTVGAGNELVCQAIEFLAQELVGKDIDELMADFGEFQRKLSNHTQFRWIGPHKGVVQLALGAITNACFDLWAKKKQVPLWKLLLDLSTEETIKLLDFSYVEDVLTKDEARVILNSHAIDRHKREGVLTENYQGYDTSIGWFNYSDEKVRENIKKSMAAGFTSMKLKVGSPDHERDLRRAYMVRECAGDAATVMLDCNQQWQLHESIEFMMKAKDMNPYWIEEPTHPDDVLGHQTLARAISPIKVACGEHVPNRVIFKNYLQSNAMHFNQVDAVRVGGISEFLLISLMSRKYNIPVVPHVGDMGQIHQHLVLYNHIAMGHEALFLEHIPHLQEHFVQPCQIVDGRYITPQDVGASSDLKCLQNDQIQVGV
ncbi:enolase C-terminal domain-like protein [Lentisphaera marina]|uniref:enolase C-terminal domain-like protein n=1 Tax=Lentisphaera marina TaxID=1111041 RepID=UPI0023665B08|nr:enolase C-terminal domain-like protein [Lentisphaera marina]MDD7987194.1 enolase C-terminal domain-like protein [Lentisphaera marina]